MMHERCGNVNTTGCRTQSSPSLQNVGSRDDDKISRGCVCGRSSVIGTVA